MWKTLPSAVRSVISFKQTIWHFMAQWTIFLYSDCGVLFLPSLRLLFVMCLCLPVSISALENSCEYIFSAVNKISPQNLLCPVPQVLSRPSRHRRLRRVNKYCNAWWGFRVSLATVQSKELVCYKRKATTRSVYSRNSLQTEHLTSYNTI